MLTQSQELLPVFALRTRVLQEEIEELETKLQQLRATRCTTAMSPSPATPSAVFIGEEEDDEVPDAPQSSPSLRVKLPWPRAQASPGNRATFELDWNFSAVHSQEQLHPQVASGTRTLLARCASSNVSTALQGMYRSVRSIGEGLLVDADDVHAKSFTGAIADGDATHYSLNTACVATALGERFPWLCVTCRDAMTEDVETRLITQLLEDGVTTSRATSLPHSVEETTTFEIPGLGGKEFALTFVTGSEPPSTLFALCSATDGGLVVAKALCAYENAELGRAGPTIVLFEVASEWRGRGVGRQLLGYVEDFFATLLLPIGLGSARLMATGVTSGAGARWLMRRGFRGEGEELSKPLADRLDADDEAVLSGVASKNS